MPIQNGRYISPTWVNNGPPAIDQAELQAITDTLEELDSGTGGGSGKRYATLVVGTSTNGWTTADCDYLCDGVDDQEEINQAIASLPNSGGEIILLDGTYYLSSNISPFQNTKLTGTYKESVTLKRMTTSGYAQNSGVNAIVVSSNNSFVGNLTIDGNSAIFQSGNTERVAEILAGGGSKIENVNFTSFINNAIYAEPITFGSTIVSGCYFSSGSSCVFVDAGGVLIFENSDAFAPKESILSAVGENSDGSPIQSTLTIFMENIVSNGVNANILLNGAGFCHISNCQCASIQITNTVATGSVSVERGHHILTGNNISPSLEGVSAILFGDGVNNCLAIGNVLSNENSSKLVENNGENNVVFNGATAGQISLTQSGWSGNSQTVQAPGVTSTSSVIVGPNPSSMSVAMQAGVYCSAQGNGTLTFTCSSTPSSSLTYNYTTQEVL